MGLNGGRVAAGVNRITLCLRGVGGIEAQSILCAELTDEESGDELGLQLLSRRVVQAI
jgi:hypothetical protein